MKEYMTSVIYVIVFAVLRIGQVLLTESESEILVEDLLSLQNQE